MLQEKFGFDRLYDWAFYRPAAALARGGGRLWEQRAVVGSMDVVSAAGSWSEPPALERAVRSRARLRPRNRARHRGARRLARDGRVVSGSWTSTLLWLVPLGGALAVLVLPLRDATRGALAMLASLVDDRRSRSPPRSTSTPRAGRSSSSRTPGCATSGLTYHVGMDGLSLVLVTLTAVCVPCALGFGLWARRPNLRAYVALILLLESAVVLLLVALDLALFYVGFEAMIAPLALLIAVWGGPNRSRAAIRFVIYTLVGSLLMLVAVITLGLQAGSFDLARVGTSDSRWLFLAFMAAFAIKSPLYPFHGWVPDAYRESPPEVAALLSGVVSKAGAYGMLRFALPLFPGPAHDLRRWFVAIAIVGLLWCSLVAFRQPDSRGVIAYSSIAQMSLIGLGIFVMNDIGATGATFQMVNHGLLTVLLFLLAGVIEVRTGEGLFRRIGALARGRAGLATFVMFAGIATLAVPGSALFASEFLVLLGAFRDWWLIGALASLAIVLAAMYALRWISALLHDAPRRPGARPLADARPALGGDLPPAARGVRARALGLPVRGHASRVALDARHRLGRHRQGRTVIAAAAAAIATPSVQLGAILPDRDPDDGRAAAAHRRQLRAQRARASPAA